MVSLLPALVVQSDAEGAAAEVSIASLGAGDADWQLEHSVRNQKLHRWLGCLETPYQVAGVLLTTTVLDRLVYDLMGGNSDAPKRPGTLARAEQPIQIKLLLTEVRDCRGRVLHMVQGFLSESSPSRELMSAMGVPPAVATSPECSRFLRRLVLGMSCGVFRRLEIRLSAWPYRLWTLVDPQATAETKGDVARALFAALPCCLGFFAHRVRNLLGTEAALCGTFGQLVLTMWLRTLVWSIYGCEREHGSIRRLVNGSTLGPARNFSLPARERILEETRNIHIDRVRVDPRLGQEELSGPTSAKRARAQKPAAPQDSPDQAMIADNPLQGILVQPPWADAVATLASSSPTAPGTQRGDDLAPARCESTS